MVTETTTTTPPAPSVTTPPTSSMTRVNTVPVQRAPAVSLKDSIKAQLTQKAQQEQLVGVKSQWNNLVMAGHVPTDHTGYIDLPEKPPVDKDIPKILAAIKNGTSAEFTSQDGKKYTFDGALLNKKVDELPAVMKAKVLKGANSLQEMFPKDDTLDSISGAIAEGANEAKQNVGFGDMIKTLFTFISALIGSWFGNGKALSWDEAKAEVAAPKVKDAINDKLDQLAARDPEAKRLLDRDDGHGHTTRDIIDDMAVAQTYRTLGVTPPPSTIPAGIALKDVKPEPVSAPSKNDLHVLVAQTVMAGVPDKDGKVTSLADTISGEMEKSVAKFTASGKMLSGQADEINGALKTFSKGVAPAVAEAFTDVVTHEGADAGKMTREAYVKDVTDKVMDKLTNTGHLAGLPKDAVDPAVEAIRKGVSERLDKMYTDTVAISVIAASATGKEDDRVKLAGSDAAGVQAAAGRLQTDMLKAVLPSVREHINVSIGSAIQGEVSATMKEHGTAAVVSDWVNQHKVATFLIGGPLIGGYLDYKAKAIPTGEDVQKLAGATTMSLTNMFDQTGFLEKFTALGKEKDGAQKQQDLIEAQLKKDLNGQAAEFPTLKDGVDKLAKETAQTVVQKLNSGDNASAIMYAETLTTDLNANAQYAIKQAAELAKNSGITGGGDASSAPVQTGPGTGPQTGTGRNS